MTDTEAQLPSIHFRRRWAYVLWVGLLLLSALAWFFWERPAGRVDSRVQLSFVIGQAPDGTKVQLWQCTAEEFEGLAANPEAWIANRKPSVATEFYGGLAGLPPAPVAVFRRRWVKDHIRHRTPEIALVRFQPMEGAARYLVYNLRPNILMDELTANRTLRMRMSLSWAALSTDPGHPTPAT